MSEKKGLIHSLEKFVFLVKRRIKKAKLKASGKPQYTVSQLKIFQQLQPGDLIFTGTPSGVALEGGKTWLKKGDVVDVEIEGIGRLTNTMI